MDLNEIADLMERVRYEERTLMEGIYIVVHSSEEQQLREVLDAAGYEPIHVVTNDLVDPGTCMVLRSPDLIPVPPLFHRDTVEPVRRRPLWKRVVESLIP